MGVCVVVFFFFPILFYKCRAWGRSDHGLFLGTIEEYLAPFWIVFYWMTLSGWKAFLHDLPVAGDPLVL